MKERETNDRNGRNIRAVCGIRIVPYVYGDNSGVCGKDAREVQAVPRGRVGLAA